MLFPGFDIFEPTALLLHAIFALRQRIPNGCESIRAEFDQQGAAYITAVRPGGGFSHVDLDEDEMGAAGLLLSYLSYQVMQLTTMKEKEGNAEVEAAHQRLAKSLRKSGLSVGLLEGLVGKDDEADYSDSLTIFRNPR